MEWIAQSEKSFTKNLANVLVLDVSYSDGFGWRATVHGRIQFPISTAFTSKEHAMRWVELYAELLLSAANDKLYG